MKAPINRRKKHINIFELDRGEEYNNNSLEFNRLISIIERKLPDEDKSLIQYLIYYRLMAEKSLAEFLVDTLKKQ